MLFDELYNCKVIFWIVQANKKLIKVSRWACIFVYSSSDSPCMLILNQYSTVPLNILECIIFRINCVYTAPTKLPLILWVRCTVVIFKPVRSTYVFTIYCTYPFCTNFLVFKVTLSVWSHREFRSFIIHFVV